MGKQAGPNRIPNAVYKKMSTVFAKAFLDGRAWVPWCAMQVSYPPDCGHSRCGNPEMPSPQCIDHLLRYSILDVSSVYRNGIETRYSIQIPTAPRTYRACIERVSNKKCLDTVSRGVYRENHDTRSIHYDTLRYTTIHYDTLRYIYREKPPRYRGKRAQRSRPSCLMTTSNGRHQC